LKNIIKNILALTIFCLAIIGVYIERKMPNYLYPKYAWLSWSIAAILFIGAIIAMIYVYKKEKK